MSKASELLDEFKKDSICIIEEKELPGQIFKAMNRIDRFKNATSPNQSKIVKEIIKLLDKLGD